MCSLFTGLLVKYEDFETPVYGSLSMDGHEFTLNPGERITAIEVRHGYLIDSLKFCTSHGRTFGPYGGQGGNPCVLKPPPNSAAYLAGVNGTIVDSQMGWQTVNKLQFTWSYYGPEELEGSQVQPEIVNLDSSGECSEYESDEDESDDSPDEILSPEDSEEEA